MKKTLFPICTLLAAGMFLTGCAANTESMPSPSPSAMTSQRPTTAPTESTTDVPGTTSPTDGTNTNAAPASAPGVTTVSDARRLSQQVEEELEKLSEVDDAQVVIAGSSAGIGLEFDPQYKGGVDDRMATMVKERIDSIVSGVDKLHITDDGDLIDQLETLSDKLDGAANMSEVRNELNAIINKIDAVS